MRWWRCCRVPIARHTAISPRNKDRIGENLPPCRKNFLILTLGGIDFDVANGVADIGNRFS